MQIVPTARMNPASFIYFCTKYNLLLLHVQQHSTGCFKTYLQVLALLEIWQDYRDESEKKNKGLEV